MLSDSQKKEFFEGLCDELKGREFGFGYSKEEELTPDVAGVLGDYRDARGYKSEICVWEDSTWVEKVDAFGHRYAPDVTMETGKAAYVAVEVKLLRDYFSLARGIGQAIINSAKYQYGIVFALDLRRPNEKHEFDDGLCASLWNNYRIRIIIGQ